MSSVPSPAEADPPPGLMPVLFTGVFMAALDTAVVAPALPALRASFGLDHRQVGLMMISYILAALVSTALLADLGDRRGRRPVYLASVGLFALGSLVVALSPAYGMVLAGRALQGVGNGGIVPTASAIIGDALGPARRGRALGLLGATYGMAFVFGPPLAGVVMVVASWHWIFLANLPIAALVVAYGLRALPTERRAGVHEPIDWTGSLLIFALLTALVLGVTRVAEGMAGAPAWPVWLVAAALLLPLLLWAESRAARPLVPLSLFANRRLATAYALTLGAGFGMGSIVFLASVATLGLGVEHDHAGFVLLPLVLCSMAGSMVAGRLLERLGSRALVIAGFVLMAPGYAAVGQTGWGLAGFLVATMPVGAGVGVVVSGALRTIAIDESPAAVRGSAQGLVNIFTSIGTLLAAAAVSAVADLVGGGAHGFAVAYLGVALVMAAMAALALALRRDRPTARG